MKAIGPRVLFLVGGNTGCEYWRVRTPVEALQAQGYPVRWCPMDHPQGLEYAAQADAVILTRLSWQPGYRAMAVQWAAMLHQMGTALLYESDDDLWTEHFRPQAQLMSPHKTVGQVDADREACRWALQLCDGATVASPRLATVARTLTDRPVVVVPNAIDWPGWRALCAQGARPSPRLTIGWAGGKRQDHDLVEMAQGWARIARRYPDVQFVLIGHQPDIIRDAVPPTQLVRVPWQPIDLYPQAYRGIDIGCAPLADTPFNRCKTAIKAFEYAAAGAAVVYSTPVYGRVLRPNLDGLEANTADEWETALARLIDDAALRQTLATRWARRVRERHSLAQNLYRWPAAWAQLVSAARGRKRLVVA